MLEGLAELIDYLLRLEGRRWLRLVIGLVVLFLIAVMLEASLHVLSAVKYRTDIAILKGLLELENEGILASSNLGPSYRRLLSDYTDLTRLRNLPVVFADSLPTTRAERLWTLLAGAALPFAIGTYAAVMASKTNRRSGCLGFIFSLFASAAVGFLSLLILPSVIGFSAFALRLAASPLAICLVVPVVQFGLVIVIGSILKTVQHRSTKADVSNADAGRRPRAPRAR